MKSNQSNQSNQTKPKKKGEQRNDVELWRKYIDNGKPIALRNRLVERNLKIIHDVINKQCRINKTLSEVDPDDLYQQGVLGLISATEKFVLEEGNYFYKFAYPFVYGRLMQWIRDKKRFIRIPVTQHDIVMRHFKVRDKLTSLNGEVPTPKQIFDYLDETDQMGRPLSYEQWLRIIRSWLQTHATLYEDMSVDKDGSGDAIRLVDSLTSKDYQDYEEHDLLTFSGKYIQNNPRLNSFMMRVRMDASIDNERRPLFNEV